MNDLVTAAKALQPQLVADRRALHQMPEVGLNLPRSAAYICERLQQLGIPYRVCGNLPAETRARYQAAMGNSIDFAHATGIVATVGQGSPCFLLRADFDALPMAEHSGLPFCATGNASHMCGHDGHAAMLLGAAALLKAREAQLKGTVKLLFQPGEELGCGSLAMLEDGLLQAPRVDAALALHVQPLLPAGHVTYCTGVATASIDTFILNIKGKGGHSSQPHLAVDPLMISNQIYQAVNLLMTRETDPQKSATLSAGVMRGGDAVNIIPETATVQFAMRTYDNATREHILQRVPALVDHYVKAWRGDYQLTAVNCPCTAINPGLAQDLLPAVRQIAGADNVHESGPMSASEDFSHIAARVPSLFLLLGAGGKGYAPLHNPEMRLDESVLPTGSALLAGCAMHWLANYTAATSANYAGAAAATF